MTTSRRPPTPPKPKLTRPLATPKPTNGDRPLTTEVMQRIRRVMEQSQGEISFPSIARDVGQNSNQISEWIGGWRSAPGSERFAELCRWLAQHDPEALREVFESRRLKSIGQVARTKGKLNAMKAALLRDNIPDFPEMNEILGALLDLSPDAIRHIRSGKRWTNAK